MVLSGQKPRLVTRVLCACLCLDLCLLWTACQRTLVDDYLSPVPDAEAVGLYHEVQEGETLGSICKLYRVDLQEVAELNGIESDKLKPNQRIFIPDVLQRPSGSASGAHKSGTTQKPESVIQQHPGEFIWPVAGVITSKFGIRAGERHDGIDIAAPAGTEVHAAADGEVMFSGQHAGYGNLLIVRHPSGMITIYAHNHTNLVREKQQVKKGQVIAKVGQTGRATGPHVHFEVREGKMPRNPLFFLPKTRP